MFLLGVVFGFITAITGDLDLTETWLVIGYVLALFILVNGLTYHRVQAEKRKAAAAGSEDVPPPRRLPRSARRAGAHRSTEAPR